MYFYVRLVHFGGTYQPRTICTTLRIVPYTQDGIGAGIFLRLNRACLVIMLLASINHRMSRTNKQKLSRNSFTAERPRYSTYWILRAYSSSSPPTHYHNPSHHRNRDFPVPSIHLTMSKSFKEEHPLGRCLWSGTMVYRRIGIFPAELRRRKPQVQRWWYVDTRQQNHSKTNNFWSINSVIDW